MKESLIAELEIVLTSHLKVIEDPKSADIA